MGGWRRRRPVDERRLTRSGCLPAGADLASGVTQPPCSSRRERQDRLCCLFPAWRRGGGGGDSGGGTGSAAPKQELPCRPYLLLFGIETGRLKARRAKSRLGNALGRLGGVTGAAYKVESKTRIWKRASEQGKMGQTSAKEG